MDVLEVLFIRMILMMSLMARMLMLMIVHSNDGNFQGDASYMLGYDEDDGSVDDEYCT